MIIRVKIAKMIADRYEELKETYPLNATIEYAAQLVLAEVISDFNIMGKHKLPAYICEGNKIVLDKRACLSFGAELFENSCYSKKIDNLPCNETNYQSILLHHKFYFIDPNKILKG